jgi:hypothetical protein
MRRSLAIFCCVVCLSPLLRAEQPATADETTTQAVSAFLQRHCAKCHDDKKESGGFRLDDISVVPGKDTERWKSIQTQLRDGLMPPPKEPRPDNAEVQKVVAWIAHRGDGRAPRLPNQGNLIPHELLFGKPADAGDPPAGRVWRLSPEGYMGFAGMFGRGRPPVGVIQPFTVVPDRGIKDFAELYTVDEPSTEILVRNAETIVNAQTGHAKISVKNVANPDALVKEFVVLMKPDTPPTKPQLEAAIRIQYRMAIGREPASDEVDRLLGLYEKAAKSGDTAGAARIMLQAVLLRTDAIFRSEFGTGSGRRMLAPQELAVAVSLALGDRREQGIHAAALKGELATKEQVASHVKRMLDDPKFNATRVPRFFREYFEYDKAPLVFKDKPKNWNHEPAVYANDTDRLVEWVLKEDRDVFRQLLTTEKTFANHGLKENKQTRRKDVVPAKVIPPIRNDKTKEYSPAVQVEAIYGLSEFPKEQPVALAGDTRIGILMQPSWLTAWSTNFDNDPVRRGRWVRERLLGGTVPDLPIGVAAQVPDDPHRTYRDRLTVTRAANCWKCHKQMDELGLPFEQFDHYGRFRTTEEVLDIEATTKNVDKKGKSLGKVFKQVELSTAGTIAGSGDPKLDSAVKDPREMIRKIAASDRARQVFIRHAFRFFMGRNETLSDAKTLQDADKAYLESGGSFKALLVSFLTSDSFLYRTNKPIGETK